MTFYDMITLPRVMLNTYFLDDIGTKFLERRK